MTKKIQFEQSEWVLIQGDIAAVRDGILQTARPHELRDPECSLAKNIIARDDLMTKIQKMLEPGEKK